MQSFCSLLPCIGGVVVVAVHAALHPKCIINVASIGQTGVLSTFSNYGEYVKIAAPGEDILSATNTSDTDTKKENGTSMATPHVAGMATLLFNTFPGVSAARVYDCIINTAKEPVKANPDVDKARLVNGGIANLKAVSCRNGVVAEIEARLVECMLCSAWL